VLDRITISPLLPVSILGIVKSLATNELPLTIALPESTPVTLTPLFCLPRDKADISPEPS